MIRRNYLTPGWLLGIGKSEIGRLGANMGLA